MATTLKVLTKNSFFTILLLAVFFSAQLNAQQLILKNYKVKDGLPSSEVYCVFQDSKGFMWFGSDGGVSKFDGYNFKNFTTEDGLADNVVFGILEDKHGRIWFRSLTGKLCYYQNDSIYKIEANELIFQHMKNAVMTSFYMDNGDTMWCGLRSGKGFFKISPRYEAKDLKIIEPELGPYYVDIEKGNFISGICFLGEKKESSSIAFFKKENLAKRIECRGLNTTHIYFSRLADDTFLMADKERLYSIQKYSVDPLLNRKRLFNSETILLKNNGGYLWTGLLRKGILRSPVNDYFSPEKTNQILDGYSVTDVTTDNEGGTWFTTLENGIFYSSPARFVSYQRPDETTLYRSYNISRIGENHLLISNKLNHVDIVSTDSIQKDVKITDEKLLSLFEKLNIQPCLITTGNTLKADSFAGYLWIKEERSFRKVTDTANDSPLIDFFSYDAKTGKNLLFDRYWVLTYNKADNYNLKVLTQLPSRAFSFYKDKKGIIWAGCLNGLWSFENEKFIYHGDENDLLKNAIEDIKEGADGTKYYATRGNGVIICKNGKYTKLTTANGLNSNNCKCLYIDENNTVWVGSKNGICKLKNSADGWQVLKFNLTDNELSYEVFRIGKIKNKLWIFTNRGLLSYEAGTSETEFPPRMYITQFSINEKQHLKDSLRIFNHDENFVKISYIGLSYQSLGKLYYTYKLDGLDTNWHTTLNTSLQYPFLPPGDYTLYVKAVSFSGVESKYQASISFTIKKPFWKTLWFILTGLIIIIGATYILFTYRLKKIQKKEEEKTLFNKQLSELEMKALRSQMNPHFIFNAINSIQNYIVKNDSRTAQDYLAKFARLIRNVLENSRHENISLNEELETLKLYIELEQLRAPGKFTYKLILQEGLHLDSLTIPPLILQPYVENAILHGLIPLTGRTGELTISIHKKANNLICIVEDNGIGRKKAAGLKQKKQLAHHSMGLSVTEDRIKVINNLHSGESGINIEDKMSAEGEPEGTKVIVVINLDK